MRTTGDEYKDMILTDKFLNRIRKDDTDGFIHKNDNNFNSCKAGLLAPKSGL